MFDGLKAWLEPYKSFDGDTCIVGYCERLRTTRWNSKGLAVGKGRMCSMHARQFFRTGQPFNNRQLRAINYYADRRWRYATEPS